MRKKKNEELDNFLTRLKDTLIHGGSKNLILVTRDKNNKTITELGFTKRNIFQEIISLSSKDYYDGPLNDKDNNGILWTFIKKIKGRNLYIKIKLKNTKDVIVISFHEAEFNNI